MKTARSLEPAHVRANLTPMIDVVFLLVIFFMLVAQISRTQIAELDPPEITNAVSAHIGDETRLVVNIVPGDSKAGAYRLGGLTFDATERGASDLSSAIVRAHARTPGVQVHVRADRSERYARVHPALEAVRAAGIETVRLVIRPMDAPL